MIKSLIAALMVSVLNAPQPNNRINTEYIDEYNNIRITNTVNNSIILNQDAGTFPEYYYQSATKTNFEISSSNYTLTGVQYAYTYGTPYTLNTPNTKFAYVDSGNDMTMLTLPHRPFNITIISLNNYKNFTDSKLNITWNWNTNSISTYEFDTNYNRNHTIYTSRSASIDNLMNSPSWNIKNNNFYLDVKTFCENDLYTNELTTLTSTGNSINLDQEDTDSLITLGQKYIIDLCYLTTSDLGSDQSVTYNPTSALGIITNDTQLNNTYENIPATIKYEYIDVPSIMFTILTMPFSFISQAFNLTLFSGTPYAINLSNMFLTVIGVLAFIFIIKLITKGG